MRRHGLLLVVLLAMMGAAAAPASAQPEDPRDVRARRQFTLGEYRQALDLYAELYAETLHPTYLRNVGRCQQMLGDNAKALISFREYLRKAKDADPGQRAEVEGFIRELEAQERQRAPHPDAPRAPPPPTGAPPIAAARPAPRTPAPLVVRTATAPREENPPPRPVYKRWWFWSGVVALAAGAAVGIALSTRSSADYQKGSAGDFAVPGGK